MRATIEGAPNLENRGNHFHAHMFSIASVLRKEMMMKLWHGLAIAGLMASLAACGENVGDRALSGAAIGAGSGAAIGAVAGPIGAGTGAAIGAGVGGVTGAVTSPSAIDLGRPAWER